MMMRRRRGGRGGEEVQKERKLPDKPGCQSG